MPPLDTTPIAVYGGIAELEGPIALDEPGPVLLVCGAFDTELDTPEA